TPLPRGKTMLTKKTASALVLAMSTLLPGLGPAQPWSRALARLAEGLRLGRLTVVFPDGTQRVISGRDGDAGGRGVLILRSDAAARALFLGGDTGFAEAYMDGLWDSPDLTALIGLAAVNQRALGTNDFGGLGPVRLLDRLRHRLRRNSKRGAKRNIAYHYDLGNAFYQGWLDPSMTYSSALFEGESESLEAAQTRKYQRLAALLSLEPGMRVLEIGCGWGGFAELAARDYGVEVVGITLSQEQLSWGRERIRRAGLEGKVDLRLQDYRDVTGQFDRVVSIEMFEAVGQDHWPIYFESLRARLKPGGLAALQVITIAADRFEDYRSGADFIQKHIFPGGMLPSVPRLLEAIDKAGLVGAEVQRFGLSYARTLDLWQRAFQHAWPRLAGETGFSDRFRRMWEYYFAYCQAGFTEGIIDVGFYTAQRPDEDPRAPTDR
ncbi:cyclopropane-fatty-acyl-phospholipid synthase family protein, partial [Rhodospirillum rubrum]